MGFAIAEYLQILLFPTDSGLCPPTTVLHMHELQAAFNVRLIVEYFMATKTIMQEEDQFVL